MSIHDLVCLTLLLLKVLRCWALSMNGFVVGSRLIVLTENRDNPQYDENAAWDTGWRNILSKYHERECRRK